jgi:hypothetical protein
MYSSQIAIHQPLWERNEPAYIAAAVPNTTLELGALRCPLLGLKSMKAPKSLDPGQTICEVSYIAAGFKGVEIPGLKDKDFVTQAKNAELVERSNRYLLL